MKDTRHRATIPNDIWELLEITHYFKHLNFQDLLRTLITEYIKNRDVSEDIKNITPELQREQLMKVTRTLDTLKTIKTVNQK